MPSLPSWGGRLSFSLRFSLASVGHVLLPWVWCLLFWADAPFLVLGEVLSVFRVLGALELLVLSFDIVGLLPFWK